MGLQALRPSAEVCKVKTVPNSHCVRVVRPDEHVITGFHEILIHDMEKEEWPPVTLSDIGYRHNIELVYVRGTLSVRAGTNEENLQGTLRTYGIWYMPHV